MSKNLAISLIGPRAGKNTATHGDTIKIELTNPPQQVDDVEIKIRTLSHVDRGSKHFAFTDVLRLQGVIRGGKFQYKGHVVVLEVDKRHPKLHEMQVTFVAPDGKKKIVTRLPDFAPSDHPNLSHRLKWQCQGKLGKQRASMTGLASLLVHYKSAMIVPTGNAPFVLQGTQRDPSLPLVAKWATQWQRHLPDYRKVFPLQTVVIPARPLTDADYAPLLRVVEQAATHAKHGIIALAVGHGDGGQTDPSGDGHAWCDLAAEDGVELDDEGQIVAVFHALNVNEFQLDEMKGVRVGNTTRLPDRDTVIIRNALDKMRATFQKHPIRVLVLHTCTAGANKKFTRLLSDRLQVYLRAHVLHVAYTFSEPVMAAYERAKPLPEGDHEWPVDHLAREVEPGAVPPSPAPVKVP